MKKLIALLLACLMLFAVAFAETVDVAASASVANFYGDYALTGDDLMNALNSFSGTYLIVTTDAEGNPNVGYFIYGMVSKDGEYYLQLGLAANQSRANLEATGKCIAVYAANPDFSDPNAKPYSVAGARMWCEAVTDEALFNELNATGSATVMFYHVVTVKPLG